MHCKCIASNRFQRVRHAEKAPREYLKSVCICDGVIQLKVVVSVSKPICLRKSQAFFSLLKTNPNKKNYDITISRIYSNFGRHQWAMCSLVQMAF